MAEAVIVDAVRSPMGRGKSGGLLLSVHPVDLLAQTFEALVRRTGLDPSCVDDVLVGCVNQIGEQSGTVGRQAWLGLGYPEHVPAVTIERKCGSGQQAIHFAAQGVIAGAYDVVIAAGVESMSAVPMGSARVGRDPFGPGVARRYEPGLISQGVAAELVAAKWNLDREMLDEYAVRSHRLAHETAMSGGFDAEIVPIRVADDGGHRSVDTDETIRSTTTVEKLRGLRPAFEDAGTSERFPEIRWSVTAGNSSQITDGASAMLIMSEERAGELGMTPRARFHAFAVGGDDPLYMLTAPIPVTQRVLERSSMSPQDIAHFEVNEAFASVPLAWQREIGADAARVNPNGGAIALGHPLGASGVRLMTTMLHALERTGGRFGLQAMCEAGGMANATIIERL
jgi:acetyl-CoA acyltransferase